MTSDTRILTWPGVLDSAGREGMTCLAVGDRAGTDAGIEQAARRVASSQVGGCSTRLILEVPKLKVPADLPTSFIPMAAVARKLAKESLHTTLVHIMRLRRDIRISRAMMCVFAKDGLHQSPERKARS